MTVISPDQLNDLINQHGTDNPAPPSGGGIISPDQLNAILKGEKPAESNAAAEQVVLPTPTEDYSQLTATEQIVPVQQEPLPFGALAMDANGLPYYGEGFKGWVRKTFGDLFDPQKAYEGIPMTNADWNQINQRRVEFQKSIEGKTDWLEKLIGLNAKDLSYIYEAGYAPTFAATKKLEGGATQTEAQKEYLGNVAAQTVRMTKDSIQRVAWGALEVLGLDDAIVRKAVASGVALDTLADELQGDKHDGFKIFDLLTENIYSSTGTVLGNLVLGRIKWGDVKQKMSDYAIGSNAAYTLWFDEQKRLEFEEGLAQGKNPGLLAASIGNPWIELAGSVLGSPSTYLGLGIPTLAKADDAGKVFRDARFLFVKLPWRIKAEIPTGAELLYNATKGKIAIGRMGLVSKVEQHYASIGDDVLEEIGRAYKAKTSEEAAALVARAAQKRVQWLSDLRSTDEAVAKKAWSGLYNAFALTASDKASMLAKDADFVIGRIWDFSKKDPDAAMLLIRDLRAAMDDTNPIAAEAAIKRILAKGEVAKFVLSDAGKNTGKLLSWMRDSTLDTLFEKYGDNAFALGDNLLAEFERVADDVFPTVERMQEAVNSIKRAKKFGETISPKEQALAEAYKNVPEWVKKFYSVAKYPEKAQSKFVGFMAGIWFRTVGFTTRNVSSTFIGTSMIMGVDAGLKTTASGFRGFSQQATDALLLHNSEKWEKFGLTMPAEARSGMGGFGMLAKDAKANAARRSEMVMSSSIVTNAVFEEIRKAMPAVLKDVVDELPFDKTQRRLFIKYMYDYHGDTAQVLGAMRKAFGGETVEIFREIPLDKDTQRYLFENNLIDSFQKIQREAKSAKEFEAEVRKLLEPVFEETRRAAASSDSLGKNVPEEIAKIHAETFAQEDELEFADRLFIRKVQAQQNLTDQMLDLNTSIYGQMKTQAGNDLGLQKQAEAFRVKFVRDFQTNANTFRQKLQVTDIISSRSRRSISGDASFEEMMRWWDDNLNGFCLRDIYPDVDPRTMTKKEFRSYLWNGYRNWANEMFVSRALDNYDVMMGDNGEIAKALRPFGIEFKELVQQLGDNDLLQQIARSHAETVYYGKIQNVSPALTYLWQTIPKDARLSSPDEFSALIDELNRATGREWNKKYLFNAVNADRIKDGARPYATFGDVKMRDAVEAALRRSLVDLNDIPQPNTYGMPTHAYSHWKAQERIQDNIAVHIEKVKKNWGAVQVSTPWNDEMEGLIAESISKIDDRMSLVKAKAVAYSVELRNFLLFDYRKTYADLALAYLSPFHYWYRKEYAMMFEQLLAEPKWARAYLLYKDRIQRMHSDLPEWWRNNIQLNLPGMDSDNQVLMNLEATINPLNGLTGVDFNDRYKRVDWMTRMLDDANKLGPTLNPVFNWGIAAYLYGKNEEDAGNRWLGRAIPQTATIKAVTSGADNLAKAIGIQNFDTRPLELDPFVLAYNNFTPTGAVDPYEEARVGRALTQWAMSAPNEEQRNLRLAQVADASYQRSGDVWNMGVEMATDVRAAGQVMSYLGGPGLKMRNQSEIEIDNFYNAYYKLVANRENMDGDTYRAAYDALRAKYPFMDTLLLSKRTGEKRVSGYAYNVLGRLPPATMNAIAEKVGITKEMIQTFYDSKGDMSKFSPAERKRFEGGIMALGALLTVPNTATRKEWGAARATYNNMKKEMEARWGKEIWDKFDEMDGMESRQKRDYIDDNPDVAAALAFQSAAIVNNPMLKKYYASFDNINSYWNAIVYQELDRRFPNIQPKLDQYNKMLLEYDLAKQQGASKEELKKLSRAYTLFKKQNNLQAYWDAQALLKNQADSKIAEMAGQLPEDKEFPIRSDYAPVSQGEAETRDWATSQNMPSVEEWRALVDNDLVWQIIENYYATGKEIPYNAQKKLDYIAGKNGMSDWRELIRRIGASMNMR